FPCRVSRHRVTSCAPGSWNLTPVSCRRATIACCIESEIRERLVAQSRSVALALVRQGDDLACNQAARELASIGGERGGHVVECATHGADGIGIERQSLEHGTRLHGMIPRARHQSRRQNRNTRWVVPRFQRGTLVRAALGPSGSFACCAARDFVISGVPLEDRPWPATPPASASSASARPDRPSRPACAPPG